MATSIGVLVEFLALNFPPLLSLFLLHSSQDFRDITRHPSSKRLHTELPALSFFAQVSSKLCHSYCLLFVSLILLKIFAILNDSLFQELDANIASTRRPSELDWSLAERITDSITLQIIQVSYCKSPVMKVGKPQQLRLWEYGCSLSCSRANKFHTSRSLFLFGQLDRLQ